MDKKVVLVALGAFVFSVFAPFAIAADHGFGAPTPDGRRSSVPEIEIPSSKLDDAFTKRAVALFRDNEDPLRVDGVGLATKLADAELREIQTTATRLAASIVKLETERPGDRMLRENHIELNGLVGVMRARALLLIARQRASLVGDNSDRANEQRRRLQRSESSILDR